MSNDNPKAFSDHVNMIDAKNTLLITVMFSFFVLGTNCYERFAYSQSIPQAAENNTIAAEKGNATLAQGNSAYNKTKSITSGGNVVSLQYKSADNNTVWLATGVWRIKLPAQPILENNNANNTNLVRFNSLISIIKSNSPELNTYRLSNFRLTAAPQNENMSTTFSGTINIATGNKTFTNVPVSIKLTGHRIISIWIEPTKVNNLFGASSIYGTIGRSIKTIG